MINVVLAVDDDLAPNATVSNSAAVTSATTDPIGTNNSSTTTMATLACTVSGTTGIDVIVVAGSSQVICGFGGSDSITVTGGSNIIFGGADGDVMKGGIGGADQMCGER